MFTQLMTSKQSNITYRRLKTLLFMFCLWISSPHASLNEDQWLMHEIDVEEGLPDPTVFSLQQDQSGFMWFGTTNGLARYDGYEMKVFTHDINNTHTISNNNAGNIFIDRSNTLWVGTFGGGINSIDLNTGQINRFPYNDIPDDDIISENVQAFFEDSRSRLWIGTATGLYHYVNDQITYHHNKLNNNNNSQYRVWDIIEDKNQSIWIGTSQGLSKLDPNTGVFDNYYLPEHLVVDLSSNQFRKLLKVNNTIWIGTSTGLYSFDMIERTFQTHPTDDKIKINDIFITHDSVALIGTHQGLLQFNLNTQSFINDHYNNPWHVLTHIDVRDIFSDSSGLLWLASRDNGVIKIDQEGGLFQLHKDKLPTKDQKNKSIWSLNTDHIQQIYLGTSQTVYRSIHGQQFKSITSNNEDHIPGIIRDIETSRDGGMWIASSEGLFYLPQGESIVQTKMEPFTLAGIKPSDVFSIVETASGTIWMTLYNRGILKWQPKNEQAELIQQYSGGALTDLNLGKIYQDTMENLWIGSSIVGLFKYDIDTDRITLFKHDFNNNRSISSNKITDIFQDSHQRLWITTSRGLNLLNEKNQDFSRYEQTDGLLSNNIETILEDSQQNLWLVYKFGISRFHPQDSEINHYILNNTIKNDGFITRSAAIDHNDVLYFGSSDGFYTFNPKDLQTSVSHKPAFMLTDINIDNEALNFEKLSGDIHTINLSPNNKVVTLKFAALEYKSTEQIKYSYRITGLNEDWYDVTTTRRIELRNLNQGHYHLEIKALNNDGRWNQQSLKLNIIKHPVWWSIGWVRVLFVMSGIILALLFHHYRTYNIKNQYQKLEDEVKMRTSELLALNQQLKTASQTDFLTGLFNRMGFISTFKKRHNKSIDSCIVLTDIDHFKKVNDTYGHSAGDEILKKVTGVMQSFLTEDDIIARWGGEEFIFYIKNKTTKQTIQLTEKMRQAIKNHSFIFKEDNISITCTFGITQCDNNIELKNAIYAADEALYQGKKNGRDMSIIYVGRTPEKY